MKGAGQAELQAEGGGLEKEASQKILTYDTTAFSIPE
jgi:hypothetical protein